MLHQLKNGDAITLEDVKEVRLYAPDPGCNPAGKPRVILSIAMIDRMATRGLDFDTFADAEAYRDELIDLAIAAQAQAAEMTAAIPATWLCPRCDTEIVRDEGRGRWVCPRCATNDYEGEKP